MCVTMRFAETADRSGAKSASFLLEDSKPSLFEMIYLLCYCLLLFAIVCYCLGLFDQIHANYKSFKGIEPSLPVILSIRSSRSGPMAITVIVLGSNCVRPASHYANHFSSLLPTTA